MTELYVRQIPLPPDAEHFEFWPRPGGDQTEPDVLITWRLPNGNPFYLMVEVKYLSGKSGEGVVPGEEGKLRDQLGREYRILESLGHGVLIYLTADRTPPVEAIRASLESVRLPDDAPIYWVGWSDVYWQIREFRKEAESRPHEERLWADMQLLLERKGLAGFHCWAELGLTLVPPLQYRYSRDARYAWPQTEVPAIRGYGRQEDVQA